MEPIEKILLQAANKVHRVPVQGTLKYFLHQHTDGSWEIIKVKADLPDDNETLKSILQSAIDRLS